MKISSCKISDVISIPASKSYANRALIIGALKDSKFTVKNVPKAQDTHDLINVLEMLGLIQKVNDTIVLEKSFPRDEVLSEKTKVLYLGEGGTTIRFLLTMLSLGKQKYKIKVHPGFKLRPYREHLDLLKALGVMVKPLDGPEELCEIQGPINLMKLNSLSVDCSKTTQIASSFLLLQVCYPLKINVINLTSSGSYYKMSQSLVSNLAHKKEYLVPVDISSASYFIALGLFLSVIEIKNLYTKDTLQADTAIFEVLDAIGAQYSFGANGCQFVPKSDYLPFSIDASQCLDLVPTLSFIAANIDGESFIHNIENLVFKETNRVKSVCDVLEKFKVSYTLINNTLVIKGSKESKNKIDHVKVAPDHRIVMMASLFLKKQGGGEVSPSHVVSKSFKNFFDLINNLNTTFMN